MIRLPQAIVAVMACTMASDLRAEWSVLPSGGSPFVRDLAPLADRPVCRRELRPVRVRLRPWSGLRPFDGSGDGAVPRRRPDPSGCLAVPEQASPTR